MLRLSVFRLAQWLFLLYTPHLHNRLFNGTTLASRRLKPVFEHEVAHLAMAALMVGKNILLAPVPLHVIESCLD